jgi:predicted Zn-dependent protease
MTWLFPIVIPGGLLAISGLLSWKKVWLVRGTLVALVPTAFPVVLLALKMQTIEEEADYIGMLLMADAGYDPTAAISAREITTARQKQQVPNRRFIQGSEE